VISRIISTKPPKIKAIREYFKITGHTLNLHMIAYPPDTAHTVFFFYFAVVIIYTMAG
jgi:hypothetical protein